MKGLIKNKALGLIETVGLVGAIEACDAAAKAANVIISAAEVTDPALVTLKIFGELAAVQAAVDSGAQAAARVGQLLAAHVIPNPDKEIEVIMSGSFKPRRPPNPMGRLTTPSPEKKKGRETPLWSVEKIEIDELGKMKVAKLRSFARSIPNLGIKGREVSRADKETLIAEIKKALGKQ